MEGPLLSFVQLEAWVVTVIECFLERKTSGGHRQKEYAYTFLKNVKLAIEQISGQIRVAFEW